MIEAGLRISGHAAQRPQRRTNGRNDLIPQHRAEHLRQRAAQRALPGDDRVTEHANPVVKLNARLARIRLRRAGNPIHARAAVLGVYLHPVVERHVLALRKRQAGRGKRCHAIVDALPDGVETAQLLHVAVQHTRKSRHA